MLKIKVLKTARALSKIRRLQSDVLKWLSSNTGSKVSPVKAIFTLQADSQ